jgi:hypothetical protein
VRRRRGKQMCWWIGVIGIVVLVGLCVAGACGGFGKKTMPKLFKVSLFILGWLTIFYLVFFISQME